jgi:uncharacterized protein (DUF58 family)
VIAPTRLLVLLGIVPLLPTLALFVAPAAWPVVVVADVAVLAVAAADLASLPRRSSLHARRELQPIATRGVRHPLTIVLENHGQRPLVVEVRDDAAESLRAEDEIAPLRLAAGSRVRVRHTVTPTERGAIRLEAIHVRTTSRLGLWSTCLALPAVDMLHVYPALRQISRYALYARLDKMSLLGVRRTRRVGTDNEFERLRDYTHDDQYKNIDWRATSRRLKLTVRDHQSNQSQRVVFAVDCGRMMVNRVGGESLLDAALDAALTLSYVAIAQRDEAGMVCFDDAVTRWLPPRAGRGQLNRMVAATHDVQPQLVESRFDAALVHLQRHCRKRTLLVVITNLIDDRNAERIREHLAPTVGRHLPLVVLLRDRAVFDPVESWERGAAAGAAAPARRAAFYRAGAAADILCWRQQVLSDLRHDGVLTLDVRPEELTAALVNEYLAIKARHLL